jgi:hypothetical protein
MGLGRAKMGVIRHVSPKVETVGKSTRIRKDATSNLGLEMTAVAQAQANTRMRSADRYLLARSVSTAMR